jgi:ubiquinone/menaquinone biosynthesis C-methylase UbiE
MAIDRGATHDVMARPLHDQAARTEFVVTLKRFLSNVSDGNRRAFDKRAAKRFAQENGYAPKDVDDIGTALKADPFYQMWSAVNRSSQDIMWINIDDSIRHDLPRMKAAAEKFRNQPAGGSLNLAPDFAAPAYAYAANIHGQPRGYMHDTGDDDLVAGALYESGGNAFSFGMGASARDSKALAVIRFLERRYTQFRPMRMLDLGCSAGSASSAYAAYFPDADVHAVDLGAAMLRYAHARAESLNARVHFHQMDAARLKFPDESFDFVVSHNVMHEVAKATLPEIFKEAYRVVRPGGLVLHQDVYVRSADASAFERFMFKWQTNNNNEPFWEDFADADTAALMRAAGFAADEVGEIPVPAIDAGRKPWYAVLGEKPDAEGRRGSRFQA